MGSYVSYKVSDYVPTSLSNPKVPFPDFRCPRQRRLSRRPLLLHHHGEPEAILRAGGHPRSGNDPLRRSPRPVGQPPRPVSLPRAWLLSRSQPWRR